MVRNMKIGIIGIGFVGLTFSIVAAKSGNYVYGTDINDDLIKKIKQGKAPFYEPNLNQHLKECMNETFFVGESLPASIKYDAFIITVGTPIDAQKKPLLNSIEDAIFSLKKIYTGDELVVLRSTVSVGTTRSLVLPILEKLSGRKGNELYVSYCPERTIEGNAIEELVTLPQVISGNNNIALQKAKNLFSSITSNVLYANSIEEAELIKLFNNTYRDICFSIGNAFCMISQMFGVDGNHAINLANCEYNRSNVGAPGFVGGPCLEKDAYILCENINSSIHKDFILNARHINENLEDIIINWLVKKYPFKDVKIGLTGMAFKGNPVTTDLRGSNSISIAKKLCALGYQLNIHDYIVKKAEIELLNIGKAYENDEIEKLICESDVMIVLNNHNKYHSLIINKTNMLNKKFIVLDVWDICEKIKTQNIVKRYTLGNLLLNKEG